MLEDASKQNTRSPSVLDEMQAGASSTLASTDEPTKVVLTPTGLYAYVRPFHARGVSYRALATCLGRGHSHASVLLLEQVAASVELGRSQKQNATVLYPLIESAYGCQVGAYVQALCRLPPTPEGAFTPAWKSMILCSKPGPIGNAIGDGVGNTIGTTIVEVAGVDDLEWVS